MLKAKPERSRAPSHIVPPPSPRTEHWKVGLLFLEAGKNVLCEKPFAMRSKQVKELVAAGKKNSVYLMEVKRKARTPYPGVSCCSNKQGHC